MSSPTFALVPGAYHRDECLQSFVKTLKTRGFEARTAALKTAGTAGSTIEDDVASIRENLLLPLLEGGHHVVLVAHSFAGASGGSAVRGLNLTERSSKGLKGGIVGIIYLSAFILPAGKSVYDFLGSGLAPWARIDEATNMTYCKTPKEIFYGDVQDQNLANELASQVVGHSTAGFASAVPPTGLHDAFFDGRRAYIRTENDQALPIQAQDMMVDKSGLRWVIKSLSTGHSPFASHPEQLADALIELGSLWAMGKAIE